MVIRASRELFLVKPPSFPAEADQGAGDGRRYAMLDHAALGAVEVSNCSAHAVVSEAKAARKSLTKGVSVDAAVSISLPRNLELRQAALYT